MKEQIEKVKEDFFILKTLVKMKKDNNVENFLIDNMLKTYATDMYLIIKNIIRSNLEFKFLTSTEENLLNNVSKEINDTKIDVLVSNLYNELDTTLIDSYIKLLYKREGKMFITGALEKTYDEEVAKVLKDAYKVIKKS